MKTFSAVVKVLTALAAVAGAVYVVATYGDKIVAWAKKMWAAMPKCPCCEEADATAAAEVPVEEAAAEEVPAEETAAEEVPAEEPAAEEIVVEENEPVAEESDFEA